MQHPGQVIIDNSVKRRTAAQIKKDKAAAEEAAAAKIASQTALAAATQARVAELEDELRRQDHKNAQAAIRPDLQISDQKKVSSFSVFES